MVNAISPDFSYQKIAPTIPLFSLYGIKHLALCVKPNKMTYRNSIIMTIFEQSEKSKLCFKF